MDSIEELAHRWRWIFKTLSDGIRRRIIGSLLEAPIGRELSLPEAANMPDYRLDPKKLRSELVHTHLPMMAKEGFIKWKQEPLSVKRGPNFEDVAAVILTIDDYDEFPQHLIEGCHFHERNLVNHD